jgi:hypothetical protein
MTPITPTQFENILRQAGYNGRSHALDMVVEVPAGARKGQPAHLIAWNNHTADAVRLEVVGGWPVVGLRIWDRANGRTVYGCGLADHRGSHFAEPGQTCANCERQFTPNEVIRPRGTCADLDRCGAEAKRLEEAARARRVQAAWDCQELARQQARRDGLGARSWMNQATANGAGSIPAHIWKRAHGDPAALEAARAEALAHLRSLS